MRNDDHSVPPLQRAVCELDRDLLLLLQRRHSLLARMGGRAGHLSADEEKALREAWQAASARVSSDPRLASQFFMLLQDMQFYVQPDSEIEQTGMRQAFNLAPARSPVRVNVHAPLDNRLTCAWLLLAAASGQAVRLDPCLVCDPQLHLLRALELMGGKPVREGDSLGVDPAAFLGAPDKSLHMGDGPFSFFLLVGHYVVRPTSRVRFSAENTLKQMDLGPVMHALPALGARLTPVVPKGNSFPLRLECSGHLPESWAVPADVPADFVCGLLLALPFADHPVTFDLAAHSERKHILADIVPLLREAGATIAQENENSITVTPAPLTIPARPRVPLDVDLCAFLVALPLILSGEVRLAGFWPDTPKGHTVADTLTACGLDLKLGGTAVIAHASQTLAFGEVDGLAQAPAIPSLAGTLAPLVTSLAACAALEGGKGRLPVHLGEDAQAFVHSVGLAQDTGGDLSKKPQPARPVVWNAPNPLWALALALAACARERTAQGFKLGNPGIIKDLWPAFWSLYNGLPAPGKPRSANRQSDGHDARDRNDREHRRIRTRANATLPPEVRNDD